MGKKRQSAQHAEKEMSLLDHLDELRTRLIIGIVALIVAVAVSWSISRPVLEMIIQPVTRLVKTAPVELQSGAETPLGLIVEPDGAVRVNYPERLAGLERLEEFYLIVPPSDDDSTTIVLALVGAGVSRGAKMIFTGPVDPLLMRLKVAIVLGILVSMFVWIWQIWLFIAPGLTDKERGVVRPMLLGAVLLFPLGAYFAYRMIFLIIVMMQRYVVTGVETLYTAHDYLKFMTTMMIVFGFIFELPLVVAIMARLGIVTPALLNQYRRHIYVGLAVVSMLITPADPYTMIMAFVPLVGLFELSILIAKPMAMLHERGQDDEDEDEEGATP